MSSTKFFLACLTWTSRDLEDLEPSASFHLRVFLRLSCKSGYWFMLLMAKISSESAWMPYWLHLPALFFMLSLKWFSFTLRQSHAKQLWSITLLSALTHDSVGFLSLTFFHPWRASMRTRNQAKRTSITKAWRVAFVASNSRCTSGSVTLHVQLL